MNSGKSHFVVLLALVGASFLQAKVTHADTIVPTWVNADSGYGIGPSAPTEAFKLNADGTITVTATATDGNGIDFVAFNSPTAVLDTFTATGSFSGVPSHYEAFLEIGTPYHGDFLGGGIIFFGPLSSISKTVSFTVGNPGEFTSAAQLFAPNGYNSSFSYGYGTNGYEVDIRTSLPGMGLHPYEYGGVVSTPEFGADGAWAAMTLLAGIGTVILGGTKRRMQ
jgi:hypothetical protein